MSEDSEAHGREQTQGTAQVPARYAGVIDSGISYRHIAVSRLSHHFDNLTSRFIRISDISGTINHTLGKLKRGSGVAVFPCIGSETASALSRESSCKAGIQAYKNIMRYHTHSGGITQK
jgi:hypothetical protein